MECVRGTGGVLVRARDPKAGIEVDVNREAYDYGRFARLHDPEGNPTELWEPA